MREIDGKVWYSASDLVNFLGCRHATFLDLRQLENPVKFDEDPAEHKLLQEKGLEHERRHLERLRAEGKRIAEIPDKAPLAERVSKTLDAMRAGFDVIYQGVLFDAPWHGYADFLVRDDDAKSDLGNWAYDIADTKLARSAKPKHVIQLCVYADLLTRAQGARPRRLHVVLGDGSIWSGTTDDFIHYFAVARDRFAEFAAAPPAASQPERCAHCEFCRWQPHCEARWTEIDHLNQVAGIAGTQIGKLRAAGIETLAALGKCAANRKPADISAETFERLRAQAPLQFHKRETGEDRVETITHAAGRGFDRLPKPDPGDIFFDMEGDPLAEGGLEYLFGLVHLEDGKPKFTAFWGHDVVGEKKAFEDTIDFIVARLERHPEARIYHYAAYEATAFGELSTKHGTREAAVDRLLREGRLVDLYKVVREGVRVSEPRYSIKNLETFYWKGKRAGEVTSAGESIVIYEKWRKLGDPALLEEIRKYNETDCLSTLACRDWLLGLRPDTADWFVRPRLSPEDAEKEAARIERERQIEAAAAKLMAGAPAAERGWRETLANLLDFHRRSAKPDWWRTFERGDADEEALVEDPDCLGAIRRDAAATPRPDKQSLVHSFTFPPQDTKLRAGGKPLRADTLKRAGEIMLLDEKAGRLELKVGPRTAPPPDAFSLIPEGPLNDQAIRDAIGRCADAVAAGRTDYRAVRDILRKAPPRLRGRTPGDAILDPGTDPVAAAAEAIAAMDSSYMLVQGPPGTGKTYTSARAIVALLAAGKRVGVSSNSHKAILNLLTEVEKVAKERKLRFKGVKKSTDEDDRLGGEQIVDVLKPEQAIDPSYQLVAGTAWLLARAEFDGMLDYLFVDEAGQVSLANVVAMGTSAKNIVLVGDQIQLAQPVKGTHPGESGKSALEYLMGDCATVPPDRGIFLARTRRMHPDVCGFVSHAFYDGRLEADKSTHGQRLERSPKLDALGLPPTGIQFVPITHEGCSQRSEAEAEAVARLYRGLVGGYWIDSHGNRKKLGTDDILVVSPYNMQVGLLAATLPAGARVGTVDKFQGQEAAIVLVSMATSSAEEMPRNIEFLFSRNRLNVAISRARCLAVVVASPDLLEVPCSTVEQMRLVDAFCRLSEFERR